MHPPKTKNRLTGFEHLEAREVPAASPLADLNTAPAPSFDWFLGTSSGDPTGAVVNGVALFAANDGVHSASVWKSDGTAAGTKMVAALPSAPGGVVTALGRPNQFTAAGGKAFFAYDDGTHGNTVWATDGTAAGTRMVADPTALGTSPWPTLIGAVGGRMLFSMTAFNSALPTARLYSSDGTAAGTTLVKDLGTYSNPSFTLAGNTLYFAVQTPPGAGAPPVTTLWKSDGTAAGTKTLADLPAGVSLAQGFFPGAPIAAVGNTVYFLGQDADHGRELWATDGTAAGTKLVKDLNTGPAAPLYPGGPVPPGTGDAAPQQLTAFGGKLYFVADDGTHGQELWSTDGTAAGTKMVTDLSPEVGSGPGAGVVMGIPTPSGSRVGGLRVLGGRLVFTADDGTHGPQVYGSDGTAAGTKALTAIEYAPLPADLPYPGYYPYTPPVLFPGDAGKATFSAEGGKDGPLFGTTDGTAAGTTTYSAGGFTGPVPVARLGGKLLLHADGPDGRQLRVTDGTAAGTKTVARINPNNLGSNPGSFVALNDKTAVFVGATGSGFATALYATDGVGTPKPLQTFDRPLPTLPIGLPGMTEVPTQLTRAGGKVFFLASAGAYGRELWVTDGTAAGTKMLKEVALPAAGAGFWGTYPAGLDNLTAGPNGTAYFTADAAGSGQQLWKTDGTAAGTVLVKQVNPASTRDPVDPTNPMPVGPVRQLTLVGNKLYFAAADGTGGDGLWTSDGTAAGTKRVAGLMTGPGGAGGSTAADFAAVGGRLVFTAPDGPGRK
ncbi:MAG: hypothetical protein K2X82_20970, partial [Gemmataceae bacterium]|nr:hypothetical protein [Gemmataceae bacterium]